MNAALLQAHAMFMRISEDQWEGLTDLPPLYQAEAGIGRAVGTAGFYGLSWHSALSQIPDMNLTQSEDVVLTRDGGRVNLAWHYYLKRFFFFFFFQTISEEANFPVLFSNRGDGS